MSVEELVQRNYEKLNDNDIYVWQYIMHHKSHVQKMSVQQLARECNVSHTSIIRFCKKLGLDGFSEFKVYIKMELEREVRIDPHIVSKTTEELIKTLADYETMQIDEVLELLYNSKRIFIHTTGEIQYNAAQEFKREFSYTNKLIYVIEGISEFDMILNGVKEDDLFLFFSFSGENPRMIENIKRMKEYNIKTIGIARGKRNRMSMYCDQYLPYIGSAYESAYSKIEYACNVHYFIIIGLLHIRYMEYCNQKESK